MAKVNVVNLTRRNKERNTIQTETEASYTVFEWMVNVISKSILMARDTGKNREKSVKFCNSTKNL